MLTVAYLANQFPSEVEPYVPDEIAELRRRGVRLVTGSVRSSTHAEEVPDIVLQQSGITVLGRAIWLIVTNGNRIFPLFMRILGGRETLARRLKALLHTFLGSCYAVLLRGRDIAHIHVHHGYFASWIGMTAARLMHVGFSMTLHGSDLLVNGSYLDTKLAYCDFCFTISEYNRNHILQQFPGVDSSKIVVSRLGVEVPVCPSPNHQQKRDLLNLLAVGRLHKVKDHAFLLRVCAELLTRGVAFECRIAGDGPERPRLESLIEKLTLQKRVTLLGHVARRHLDPLYHTADVVVLTSRSEGIPIVLMEAMARGKIVLAPAITGIPELVKPGDTGFLYKPGSVEDCAAHLRMLDLLLRSEQASLLQHPPSSESASLLQRIRSGAIAHVQQHFSREKNLEIFADLFLERIAAPTESTTDANLVLQQI